MKPAILQTCRQIYHEAVPILYSQNVFSIVAANHMLNLTAQIGTTNVRRVRSLALWVPGFCEPLPWVMLLNTLAESATGLRSSGNLLGCEARISLASGSTAEFGDNLLFVHALERVKQLDELKITGLYAKCWPSYLEEEMGVQLLHIEYGRPMKSYVGIGGLGLKGRAKRRNLSAI